VYIKLIQEWGCDNAGDLFYFLQKDTKAFFVKGCNKKGIYNFVHSKVIIQYLVYVNVNILS